MAKQLSTYKLKGTIGDITFLKSNGEFLAKQKTSLDAARIKTDASFQRTRENNAEFGSAGKAGKVLRDAFQFLLQDGKDNRMTSRLTGRMLKVVQTDTVSARGARSVVNGNMQLLNGFGFNAHANLDTTFKAPLACSIDRVTGALTVNIAPFNPAAMVSAPSGTTHFKIVSAGAEVNFTNAISSNDMNESAILPWDNNPTALISLVNSVPANSTHSLFLVLGIQFFQKINSVYYPLKSGSYNALSIVKVS
ncbi:MAG: hypothetical protein ACJ748_15640 [Flavisolibacter sp.]